VSWQRCRVLVTGAGGFIGSHLTEALVALGARARAFVHYRADGSWGWLDSSPCRHDVEVIAGDIRDPEDVGRAVRGSEIVFHLAALITIPYSYSAPKSYLLTNCEGTLHVLQAARDAGVARLVHTSTSEVYGTARYVPIDEAHPLQAQSPYAASKIAADKLAEAFFHSFGLPVVTLRPFNTFGPRQSTRAVIPAIAAQCLTGSVVRLGNLEPTRDLSYVADTVDGFLRAAAAPNVVGRTINIGSGRETSIGHLAEMIAAIAERDVVIERDKERVRPETSEVGRLVADTRTARELLGWEPNVKLEEGLQRTINWIQEHLEACRDGAYVV